jgi:hypothetical protein
VRGRHALRPFHCTSQLCSVPNNKETEPARFQICLQSTHSGSPSFTTTLNCVTCAFPRFSKAHQTATHSNRKFARLNVFRQHDTRQHDIIFCLFARKVSQTALTVAREPTAGVSSAVYPTSWGRSLAVCKTVLSARDLPRGANQSVSGRWARCRTGSTSLAGPLNHSRMGASNSACSQTDQGSLMQRLHDRCANRKGGHQPLEPAPLTPTTRRPPNHFV